MADNAATMTGGAGTAVDGERPGAEEAAGTDGQAEFLPRVRYGEWPSPITAEWVAGGRTRLDFAIAVGSSVWWQEDRPGESGRTTIMRGDGSGEPAMLLPAPWSARNRVHEYGGLSYLPLSAAAMPGAGRRAFVFANFEDQRLYLADGDGQPVPLTPDPTLAGSAAGPADGGPGSRADGTGPRKAPGARGLRYADFTVSPDGREIWCVRERHYDGKVRHAIVAVPLDGSGGTDPVAIRVLVTGWDFFAFPMPSPDGRWLAWICWNHPHMPWDGTELRVAPVSDGVVGKARLLKGSNRESVLAPVWRDNDSLYVATDWTGWWNIYQVGLHGAPPQALYPADEEFAGPLWQLGGRPFARLGDGRLAVLHGRGGARLGVLDPETSELADVELPFSVIVGGVSADGTMIAAIGGAPREPSSVLRVDVTSGEFTALRAEITDMPDRRYLSVPRHTELEGPYGRVVHALVYPPTTPDAVGPAGELPTYIVWVHGGPTGHVIERLSLEKTYFTSRGIGIIDVNYGGSSGYGRLYRTRLNREWGVVDVADAKEAARSLASMGEADASRLGIRGGSAGGWTALAAVTTGAVSDPVFTVAVSYFGVSDLRGFAAATHDFESRYLDGLIGPLPGFEPVYIERAPVGHVNPNTCPVLLLQGLDDPVVPPVQSENIAADLAKHGIVHAYLAFEGESHGFRRTETIVTSMQAELSFYGQVFGFTPPGVPRITLLGGAG